MRRHGRAHGGILAAQERIAGTFVVEGGWQAGLVCRAQAADFGGADYLDIPAFLRRQAD